MVVEWDESAPEDVPTIDLEDSLLTYATDSVKNENEKLERKVDFLIQNMALLNLNNLLNLVVQLSYGVHESVIIRYEPEAAKIFGRRNLKFQVILNKKKKNWKGMAGLELRRDLKPVLWTLNSL